MAGIKISNLPAAPSAQLTDVFPVDQGLDTYKESNSQLLTLFKSNGEALSKTDDTNVTMTLSGAPTTALLNATSMTLGWTGQLSVPRGGTGVSTFTAYSVICGGTTATGPLQNVVGLGNAGEQLTSNGPGALPTWQTGTNVTPSALTRVDDTNVTLTLGGTPATALLQATSLTLGWSGQLSGSRGGTGVNNGSNTATYAGNLNFASSFTTSGAFAVTQTYTGITNVTFPTSGTLATTSQLPTPAALTRVDDTNVTLTLGGTPSTALLQAVSITAGWSGQLSVARGGTGLAALTSHYLLIGNGTSAATLLAPSATSGVPLISQGSSADPAYGTAVVAGGGTGLTSTTAYAVLCGGTTSTGALQSVASVGTAGQVLASNGAGALPTFQSLITDWVAYTPTFTGFGTVSNVQVWSRRVGQSLYIRGRFQSGTPTGVEARITLGYAGTNANVTSSNTTITSIQLAGNEVVNFNQTANVVTLIEANVGYFTFGLQSSVTSGLTKILGTDIAINSSSVISFKAEIPVDSFP